MSSLTSMSLPTPPVIKKLDRISPTIYEAAIRCNSRAAWLAGGDRKLLPAHPRALLGIGVHTVLERARQRGIAATTDDERRAEAERIFAERMDQLFASAHPLLHAKFEAADRLPFYNLYRARAAQMASDTVAAMGPRTHDRGTGSGPIVEASLNSRDGRVTGRADVLDPTNETVIDYKTGTPNGSSAITEGELRQLRLYAFLASENGVTIRRGVIERADRTRAEVTISPDQAAEEGRKAVAVLDRYNRLAGGSFDSGTSPSHEACRFCPCIPFCEAFWKRAEVEWSGECGTQVEGVVESVEGDALVTINLEVTRGTGVRGKAAITRLSREWFARMGAAVPGAQQTIRVTDAAYIAESTDPAVFRADRTMTAIWTVQPAP